MTEHVDCPKFRQYLGRLRNKLLQELSFADETRARKAASDAWVPSIPQRNSWLPPAAVAYGPKIRIFIGVPLAKPGAILTLKDDFADQDVVPGTEALTPEDALRYCFDFPPSVDIEAIRAWLVDAGTAIAAFLDGANVHVEEHNRQCAQMMSDRVAAVTRAPRILGELGTA